MKPKKKTQKERRMAVQARKVCSFCQRDHPVETRERQLLGLAPGAEVSDIMKALRANQVGEKWSGRAKLENDYAKDYWVKNEDTWTRVHREPRMAQGTPWLWQGGPVTAGYTLLSRRTTKRLFEDSGLEDVIEDEWDAPDVALPTEERWTGTTTFYVDTDVARRLNPASTDVCYALLEGGATVRAKEARSIRSGQISCCPIGSRSRRPSRSSLLDS